MKLLSLFLTLCASIYSISGQTTWTGNVSQAWEMSDNWTNGLPGPGNDAIVPDVVNDPIITQPTIFNHSLTLSGRLDVNAITSAEQFITVEATGNLWIGDTVVSASILTNHGAIYFVDNFTSTLIISASGNFQNHGIVNSGTNVTGILLNSGMLVNHENATIYVPHPDNLGLTNDGTVINNGSILGHGFYNNGDMTNNTLIDIIEAWNCVNFINNGTFITDRGISSDCSPGGTGYFHNTICGYFLKEDSPFLGSVLIDLNEGIVVDLDDNVTILEDNGVYSTTFIPDAPIITCLDIEVYLDEDGFNPPLTLEMVAEYADCGDQIIIIDAPVLSCAHVNEEVEIQIGYLNAGEEEYLCTTNVVLLDTTPPVIEPLPSVFAQIECGEPLPDSPQLITSDNCDDAPFAIDFILPYEEHPCDGYFITYYWEVYDQSINSSIITSDLEVLPDQEAPVIICIDTFVINLDDEDVTVLGEDLVLSVTDACTATNLSGQGYTFSPGGGGFYLAIIGAFDECLNMSTCTTVIHVIDGMDTIPPVIDCPADTIVYVDAGWCLGIFTPFITASDNSGYNDLMLLDSSLYHPDSLYLKGNYHFTYVATDPSGNMDTCSFTLHVLDTFPPIILNLASLEFNVVDEINCLADYELIPPQIFYECSFAISYIFYSSSPPYPGPYSPGTIIQIIYATSDEFGVLDTFLLVDTVPFDIFDVSILYCPGDTTLFQNSECLSGLYWDEPILSGTCNLGEAGSNMEAGDTLLPGIYTAEYVYTDVNDSVYICSFEITVEEVDTIITELLLCSGDIIDSPGGPIAEDGLYCWAADTGCLVMQCWEVHFLPEIITVIDSVICGDDTMNIDTGTFTFVLVSHTGCDSFVVINISICTATDHPSADDKIRIYPNPALENIFIEYTAWTNAEITYELSLVNGILLSTGKLEGKTASISVPEGLRGLAILKIADGRDVYIERILLVQK